MPTHTTVREEYRGRGWSWLLIRFALDGLAARGGTITDYCPVVDRFIEENPGYARLIGLDPPGNWSRSGWEECGGAVLGSSSPLGWSRSRDGLGDYAG